MPELRFNPKGTTRTLVDFPGVLSKVQSGDEVIICLNTGLLEIIRKLLAERGLWRTTYVVSQGEHTYQIPDDTEFNPVKQVINEFLEETAVSSCLQAFTEIANAIRYLADKQNRCCGSAPNIIQGQTPNGTILYGSVPPSETVENVGTPPGDAATWDEYFATKCQVANFLVDALIGNVRFIGSVDAANLVGLSALLGAGLAGIVAFPPAAIPVIVGAVLLLGVGLGILFQVADWLAANRDLLVCDLYGSENVTQAVEAVMTRIDEAIDDLAIAPLLAGPIRTIANALANVDSLNDLFNGETKINYPGADCTGCGQETCVQEWDLWQGVGIILSDGIANGVRTVRVQTENMTTPPELPYRAQFGAPGCVIEFGECYLVSGSFDVMQIQGGTPVIPSNLEGVQTDYIQFFSDTPCVVQFQLKEVQEGLLRMAPVDKEWKDIIPVDKNI